MAQFITYEYEKMSTYHLPVERDTITYNHPRTFNMKDVDGRRGPWSITISDVGTSEIIGEWLFIQDGYKTHAIHGLSKEEMESVEPTSTSIRFYRRPVPEHIITKHTS